MDQQIERIGSLFEKLLGITLSEIEMGDYNEVLNSLDGIDNLLNKVITQKDKEKAMLLFQYNKIQRSDNPLVKSSHKQDARITYKTFNEIIITGLTQIWKKAYLNERSEICLRSYEILFSLLEFCQYSNKNYDLAYSILGSFSDITLFCSLNFNPKLIGQISNVGFHWYENWAYLSLQKVNDFSRIEYYYKLFRNFLWINFQYYIDAKSDAFFEPLLTSIYDGFRFSNSYYSATVYSTLLFITGNKELNELLENIYKSSKEVRNIKNLSELKNWWSRFITNNKKLLEIVEKDKRISKLLEDIKSKTKDTWENVIGVFFFNDLKKLLAFVASYALFVGNLRFVYEFWHYNQPRDAVAVNSGNKLLPETMNEIINAYVRFDYFNSITDYHLPGHHEIGYYYKQYLTLLFLRQYTLPKLYDYQDFLSIDGIPNTIEYNEIDNYINNVNGFKVRLSSTLNDQKLLDELKINPETLFKEKPKPSEILDDLIDKLKEEKEKFEQEVELDPGAVSSFKSSVIDIYKKNSFYRNIFVNLFEFMTEIEITKTNPDSVSFGIDEVNIKNFLAKGNTGIYFGFSERYGRELSYQENNVIRHEIISSLVHKEIKIEEVLETLNIIDLTDKVIISRNIDFAYEVLQNIKEFTPKHEVADMDEKNPLYNVFSGRYNGCDIYTHYDEIGWKGFFIINKNGSGTIRQYKPGAQAKEEDFIEHVLFKVQAYSDPENKEMLESLIEASPSWLKEQGDKKEQLSFLKKQIRIRIAESLKISFNKNFSGYSYHIK